MRPRPRLIAIVGGSGSGKSWLARGLARRLGPGATVLELDRFYRDRSHLSRTRADRLNFDHPRALDWGLFHRLLGRMLRGHPVEAPRYNYLTHERFFDSKRLVPGRWILVEGLWALRSREVRRQLWLGIYLECSIKTRLARRLARDAQERRLPRKLVLSQFHRQVQPMHRRFVAPQRRNAHLIVRSPVAPSTLRRIVGCLHGAATDAPPARPD